MMDLIERADDRWARLSPRQRWTYAWREARLGSTEKSHLNPHMFPLLRKARDVLRDASERHVSERSLS